MEKELLNQEEINQIECEFEVVKPCEHKNKVKRVLAAYCTCEVTAVFCEDCGEQLSEEQWEC